MKYRLYQQARNLSWEVIRDCKINCFPVNLGAICRHYEIKTIPYSKFTLWDMVDPLAIVTIQNSNFLFIFLSITMNKTEISKKGDGFSLKFEEQYYIIFNDYVNNLGRIRFTIAHEVGHILLGHVESITFYRNSEIDSNTNEEEAQANIFARDLLMPAAVLSALHVHSPKEIATLCNISMQSAGIRAQRLAVLNKRGCFQMHPLERGAVKEFAPYIEKMNKEK